MVRFFVLLILCGLIAPFFPADEIWAQSSGGVRGIVYDKDFDAPLPNAKISIAETGQSVETTEEGNYFLSDLEPGTYTMVISRDGYTRQVKSDVVVSPGAITELDSWLTGEFTEMEEFVVQELTFDSALEEGLFEMPLLELRLDSPAFLDSISADLMSSAGASDAAQAVTLVAGASIQDGKYAVVRGLPDRYVNSQINSIRLPTADSDKRAVQLDQFPSAVIDNIVISKTFTPDQQGDASGGAVNLKLKGIPEETVKKFSVQYGANTNTAGINNFLNYRGGGLSDWGRIENAPQYQNLGGNWNGAVGTSRTNAPVDYKLTWDLGGSTDLTDQWKIGGLTSFYYQRDSSYYDDGIDDKYWVEKPGSAMSPQYFRGSPSQGDFKTQLFDVTKGELELKWGALGVLGLESENHSFTLVSMYTRVAQDKAILATNTRGKEYYFPGFDYNDPLDPANRERDFSPFLRTETLEYTERSTKLLQLAGDHKLWDPGTNFRYIDFLSPQIDWYWSYSAADMYQPDKRQFGELWWAEYYNPGYPPYLPPSNEPAVHRPFKPAENFTLGNVQRIWKDITEESDQFAVNLKFPFEQWDGEEGFLKFGVFNDDVHRQYNQESFSNFNDNTAEYFGTFDDHWSQYFPYEDHPITAAEIDVDYTANQNIKAWYYMLDMPVSPSLKFIGGARFEDTTLNIINYPERDVTWIPPGSPGQVRLNPGDADVSFEQSDMLPSIGFVYSPEEKFTLRGAYTETVARQTFKELTPIQQQEFLGGDVFIGNPFLKMSSLKNYDLRFDYNPNEQGFFSLSYFYKNIKDPIEYVQRIADFPYTTPINYPKGTISGYEIEIRQGLGHYYDRLEGLTVRFNATFIDSEVFLPDEEADDFLQPNIMAPMPSRHMTNAPKRLLNFFLSYDLSNIGIKDTDVGLYYTVRGDTLIAGAGQSKGKFVPNVYEKEFGTLNFNLTKKISDRWKFRFQAKNLTNPKIQTVYRSAYIGDDVTKTSYRKGMDFTFTLTGNF